VLNEVHHLDARNWTRFQWTTKHLNMKSETLQVAVLQHLYELAAATQQPNVRCIAEAVGARLAPVADALSALHVAGLVDATRLRLTLPGLAVAVAMRAGSARGLPLAA